MSKTFEEVKEMVKDYSVTVHNDEYDMDVTFTGTYNMDMISKISDKIAEQAMNAGYYPELIDAMIAYYILKLSDIEINDEEDVVDVDDFYVIYSNLNIESLLLEKSDVYWNMISTLRGTVYQKIEYYQNESKYMLCDEIHMYLTELLAKMGDLDVESILDGVVKDE